MTFSGSILSPFERESSSLKDATPGPKSDGLNSAVTSPRAPRRSERTGDGFERGDNTFEGCTYLSGTVDIKEKAPKGRAVFVRFAVVSRTEKSIGSSSQGGTGAGTGTGLFNLNAHLFLEVGHGQALPVQKIFNKLQFMTFIGVARDHKHIERCLMYRYNGM